MSAAMDEQQMLLIMKYYDGECSEVEVLHAERLLREGDDVGSVIEKFSGLGGMVEEWGHTVQSRMTWVPDVDAIMREVESRQRSSVRQVSVPTIDTITSGARDPQVGGASKVRGGLSNRSSFLGRLWAKSESSSNGCGSDVVRCFDLWHGLGWASSGALVAASLVLLFGISGRLSFFERNGVTSGAGNTQASGFKVVSGEGLITGGDRGTAGTSFVNEKKPSSRITQPLVRPWDQTEGMATSLEEVKNSRKDKKQK